MGYGKNVDDPQHMPTGGALQPRMSRERRLDSVTVSRGGYQIVDESDDWKIPPELKARVIRASESWNGEKWYPGCYSGDSQPHVFKVGLVADVAAVKKHGDRLRDLIEDTIAKTSFIYESQLNIKIEISELQIYTSSETAPVYANDDCPDIYTQIDNFTTGANLPGGAVHLLSGCGKGWGTVGLAYLGTMCIDGYSKGVNQLHNSNSWLIFAHELGHNFNGEHSFEEGQGSTGGIMDYGDGTLNGEYQFNTKYRKEDMCATMNARVNRCGGNFDKMPAQQPSPTHRPTPSPTSSPTHRSTPSPTSFPTPPPTASPTPHDSLVSGSTTSAIVVPFTCVTIMALVSASKQSKL